MTHSISKNGIVQHWVHHGNIPRRLSTQSPTQVKIMGKFPSLSLPADWTINLNAQRDKMVTTECNFCGLCDMGAGRA